MRRLLPFLLMVLASSLAWPQAVVVAEFDHPPFAYLDPATQRSMGPEITYISKILGSAGYQARFTFVPFPRMLAYLETGEADIGALLMKTSQRENILLFSAMPALKMPAVLIVRADSSIHALVSKPDINGLHLGLGDGISPPAFFSDILSYDLASGLDSTRVNLVKLLAKRIDGAIEVNPYAVRLELKKLGSLDKVRLLEVPDSTRSFYITISKASKRSAQLVKVIDSAMGGYSLEAMLDVSE